MMKTTMINTDLTTGAMNDEDIENDEQQGSVKKWIVELYGLYLRFHRIYHFQGLNKIYFSASVM
jgi:hypothetical protein